MQPTNVTKSKFTLSPTNLVVPMCISCMIYALYIDSILNTMTNNTHMEQSGAYTQNDFYIRSFGSRRV